MRLDGVEIKFSLAGSRVDEALNALGLDDGGGRPRGISFLEDATVGVDLPLLRQGIVLRVRQTAGEDDDSTVKLRPCRRSQLTREWTGEEDGDGWRLRVEEDWAATRRSLAASCVSDLPQGRIDAVRAGTAPVRQLFGEGQRRFLGECAGMRIELDALTLLPAVAATRWEDVRVGDVDEVVVERWTLDDLDFLELSIRKKSVEKAQSAQRKLEQELADRGLERDDDTSKTERVLRHLVGLR
jgi:hypothetical protein